jgi:hypothetical protein
VIELSAALAWNADQTSHLLCSLLYPLFRRRAQHRGEFWATSPVARPVVRAFTRRNLLPVAVGPLAAAAWKRGQSGVEALSLESATWQPTVECDSSGVPTGDAARLVSIMQTLQLALRASSTTPTSATIPVYVACSMEGCTAAQQLLLPYVQVL